MNVYPFTQGAWHLLVRARMPTPAWHARSLAGGIPGTRGDALSLSDWDFKITTRAFAEVQQRPAPGLRCLAWSCPLGLAGGWDLGPRRAHSRPGGGRLAAVHSDGHCEPKATI
jgi:hypothetical protein